VDVAPRPLSKAESAVLEVLLSQEFEGVHELRRQAVGAQVVGRCECGCPTVNIVADEAAPSSRIVGPLAPVELRITPLGDEPPGEVLLFVEAGRMTSLEYVFYSGLPPTDWPEVERVTVVGR
jgi:hypothetical protein